MVIVIVTIRIRYPFQPLIKLYSSKYGLIYPTTRTHLTRPFYRVKHPSGGYDACPFILFNTREAVVQHALQQLSQISQLEERVIIELDYIGMYESDNRELDQPTKLEYQNDDGEQSSGDSGDGEDSGEEEVDVEDQEYKISSTKYSYTQNTPTTRSKSRNQNSPSLPTSPADFPPRRTPKQINKSQELRVTSQPPNKTKKNTPRAKKRDDDPDFEVEDVISKFKNLDYKGS